MMSATEQKVLEAEKPSSRSGLSCPELLAPAGDWECAQAAVENGADAIYFGLEQFNARMRAHNFTTADLPKLMAFVHRRGVKGYVTFNTLIFENELAHAEEYLRAIIAAGVDAAIVQDVGICRLIRKLSPDFPIHASTQMTITSAAGVEFARELGCNLVVLARECSLKEIEKIQAATSAGLGTQGSLPLEVFVHGALCVAYSGQCLTSEALGGRSANRGECAQACRMPYDLICDGKTVPLGDKRYLLSPQDLAGLEVLPELIRSGVSSLKIEGRLKSPEYVANITRVYRKALDEVTKSLERDSRVAETLAQVEEKSRYDLEMGFSRGLYTGWFRGINNQELAHARFGKKRGVFLGEVKQIQGRRVVLELQAPLKPGDGVVFDAGHPDQEEEGGRVYAVQLKGKEATLQFGDRDIDFARVHVGDRLWKTSDPELDKRLRQTFQAEQPQFLRPIWIEVHGHVGAPLTMIVRDELGHTIQQASTISLAKAEKQPLTTAKLEEQLGRLGGTGFRLEKLINKLEGDVIVPVSELNRLRREAVQALGALRSEPKRWQMTDPVRREQPAESDQRRQAQSELVVLVRSMAQLEMALQCGVSTLYCDFENPKKYRDAVQVAHQSFGCSDPGKTVWVAPPRIFKTGEEWILQQVRSANADGYLVRNYDHLSFFKDDRRRGDFSLNVANHWTAKYFRERFGLERVTPSYDLNFSQLEALLKASPPEWYEVTIHQHMPMFHMEHCVFCAFLSTGTDYTNCGRPCDKHEVKLRDRVGMEHVLKADIGCRNTVFHALAQTGAEYVNRMQALGVQHFRIEFVNESPEQVKQVITKYRLLLRGEISGSELWRELKLVNQLGVTRGQMEGR
jgi:putative protease